MYTDMLKQKGFEASNQGGMELLSAKEQHEVLKLGKGVSESGGFPSAGEAGVETESQEKTEMDPRKYPWDCEPYKTPEECKKAVGDYGGAELAMLPYELRSTEVCLAAVKADKSGDYPGALFYVPEGLKTAGLCLAAVKANPSALKFVPENLKTMELCKVAVKGDPMALEYAPGSHAGELIDFIKAEIPNYEECGVCILE